MPPWVLSDYASKSPRWPRKWKVEADRIGDSRRHRLGDFPFDLEVRAAVTLSRRSAARWSAVRPGAERPSGAHFAMDDVMLGLSGLTTTVLVFHRDRSVTESQVNRPVVREGVYLYRLQVGKLRIPQLDSRVGKTHRFSSLGNRHVWPPVSRPRICPSFAPLSWPCRGLRAAGRRGMSRPDRRGHVEPRTSHRQPVSPVGGTPR